MQRTPPSSLRQVLARNVKSRREYLNLSQERLAQEASFDRTYISQIERGVRNISLDNLYRLSLALAIEPWILIKSPEEA
ncbi:helix-turn-helix domain-containing protein [Caulobacter segnis]|uniref:helix-turn-helix domain-containing protein n=1 Tax=Caulobacter segnis TaxID=88688 RepID=UPI0038575B1C